jgi:predicted RNA-binding protein with EMAP domain
MAMGKAKRAAKAAKRTEPERTGDAKLLSKADAVKLSGGIWKPEVAGDSIAGKVTSLGESKGKWGKQLVLNIDTGDKDVKVVYANESMRRGLEENGIKVGHRVAIQFRGEIKTGKGGRFKLFAVAKG